MKSRSCPHCQQPVFSGTVWAFLKQTEFECINCGKHSRFGFKFFIFLFVGISVLTRVILGFSTLAVFTWLAGIIVIPVIAAQWIPLTPTPSYTRTTAQQHKWYQAPVLWIAIIVSLVVVYWESLGLE